MKSLTAFLKKEIVFSIACILAVASCFFVTPSSDYISYIDFRTLSLLLVLMLVVQGLKSCRVFDFLISILIQRVKSKRQLTLMLVMVCFFSSMLITNDVALITFIPFTIILLDYLDDPGYNIYLIVMETIAANLGSMLTPIGNPQNLYLFSLSAMNIKQFISLMLPYAALSLSLLVAGSLLVKPDRLTNTEYNSVSRSALPKIKLIIYFVLFGICLCTVLSVLDYRIMLLIVLICIILCDYNLIFKADYVLLFTFIAFFIFIGNIKNIPCINHWLSALTRDRECITGILSSQVISNVPAAMLLSGFTTDFDGLIIGCNLGGLGTIIASMASLISFKFYGKTSGSSTGKYLLCFSLINVVFLSLLFFLYMLIHR